MPYIKQLSTKEENLPLLSVANLIKGIKALEEIISNYLQELKVHFKVQKLFVLMGEGLKKL